MLTGEAVALDVQPLGFVARAVGALIDVALMLLCYLGAFLFIAWLGNQGALDDQTARILNVIVIVVIAVAIPTAVETASRGRSLGKLIMGGRIVRADGGTIGFRHAFIRALVGTIEVLATFGSIALIVGIFTPRAQRLGDLMAGTYCERVRMPALPKSTLAMPPQLYEWANVADVSRMPDPLARRLWQFSHQVDAIVPASRIRVATDLLAQAEDYVHPLPATDPVTAVVGIVVLRRDRELRAMGARNERAGYLLGSAPEI